MLANIQGCQRIELECKTYSERFVPFSVHRLSLGHQFFFINILLAALENQIHNKIGMLQAHYND